jgi:hypothetical protein
MNSRWLIKKNELRARRLLRLVHHRVVRLPKMRHTVAYQRTLFWGQHKVNVCGVHILKKT